MDTYELLSKITKLPIVADSLSADMLSGNFRSVFKGQGLEFDEARHYQWGDDIKGIDWNASARLGTPFVKMFREERELTILLLLDTSASMNSSMANVWGKAESANPYEQALIVAALIAFSAERSGQRVGAFLFDREIERVFPPRKGRRNVLAFVSGALQHHRSAGSSGQKPLHNDGKGSNLRTALEGAGRLLKRRSMVVLLSDFLSVGWEHELSDLGRRHDVIAIRVTDPSGGDLDDLGLITVEDPETGYQLPALTNSPSFRKAWATWHEERSDLWQNLCRRAGVASLEISAGTDATPALRRFFSGRGGR
jgi:uncharacterized protein (DUF58 family)